MPSALYGLGFPGIWRKVSTCRMMLGSGLEPCMVESSLEDIVDEGGSSGKGGKTLYGATENAWGLVNWNNYGA